MQDKGGLELNGFSSAARSFGSGSLSVGGKLGFSEHFRPLGCCALAAGSSVLSRHQDNWVTANTEGHNMGDGFERQAPEARKGDRGESGAAGSPLTDENILRLGRNEPLQPGSPETGCNAISARRDGTEKEDKAPADARRNLKSVVMSISPPRAGAGEAQSCGGGVIRTYKSYFPIAAYAWIYCYGLLGVTPPPRDPGTLSQAVAQG